MRLLQEVMPARLWYQWYQCGTIDSENTIGVCCMSWRRMWC